MEENGKLTFQKVCGEYYFKYEENGQVYIDTFLTPSLKHRLLLAIIAADQDAVADEPVIDIAAVV